MLMFLYFQNLGEPFHSNIYNNLGEVMDLLALINNGVNFILYCTMSRQFRKTFQKTFCCNCICFFRPIKKAGKTISNSNQLLNKNRNSIPNEKINLLSQRINQTEMIKKKSLNEIDDDDQELVTINETKQNSSTVEFDDELIREDDLKNSSINKLRKCSLQQETIMECREKDTDLDLNLNSILSNCNSTSVNCSDQLKNNDENKDDFINSKLRVHRNSSIDSTCDHSRRKLLRRHNDSRKRYRRKTIDASMTTCV